jgi:hypothetical protein
MRRLILSTALAGALIVGACAPRQVSGSLLASYDAAVSAEIVYLKTGQATPAQATDLRTKRLIADAAVSRVVTAEAAGGSTAALVAAAQEAIAAFAAASKGK